MEAIHKLFGDCTPMTESEANEIVNRLSYIMNEIGIKFSPIGSFNKKVDGSLYNDIDIAIECPFEIGRDLISQICRDNEDTTKLAKLNEKFNTITIEYILNPEHNAQVDFMFCDNIEFAKFAFHSPDFKKQESKYKGMFASISLSFSLSISISTTSKACFPEILSTSTACFRLSTSFSFSKFPSKIADLASRLSI